jgi:hypothetical protein
MTESTKALPPADDWPLSPPAAMRLEVPAGVDAGAAGPGATHPSVRELLTELAALEDATRAAVASSDGIGPADLMAALAREQEIIAELHRQQQPDPS